MKLAFPQIKLALPTKLAWPAFRLPQASEADADILGATQTIDAKRLVRTGVAVIIGFFGFVGGWAALSPLDSAAITYGVVGAEGNRKAVQHPDGGVVKQLLVREGDFVKDGQEIIQLEQVQARAAVEIYNAAVDTNSAALARLEAESAPAETIKFPQELLDRANEAAVQDLMRSQTQLLSASRTALTAQIDTFREQINQAKSQMTIYRSQAETAEKQYKMVNEELAPKQMLYDKGYGTNSPLMQLRRAATALLGQKKEFTGNIERLEHSIAQLESQIDQTRSDRQLKVAQELEDARNKLADAKERQRAAQDVLDRTIIRAPTSGHVLGLSVTTAGAVIGRGEKLMEIVPSNASLIVRARLKPTDGAEVTSGMEAELRFLSAQGRKLPMIRGMVRTRSADTRADQANGEPFYDIEVGINAEHAELVKDLNLQPGTPVEVILPTGSRSALEYMFEPISTSLRHGMREK